MANEKQKTPPTSSLEVELAAATRADGIIAVNPGGHLVRLRPGSVQVAHDEQRGLHLRGLKPGFKLATAADAEKFAAAAAELEKKRPRGTPSPKKSGA